MLPKSASVSSFEGDSDEELPCVTLSQSTGSKSELEMPSASEVASLRAREEAAERALRDLRDSSKEPLLISLSRSASQGSSGEEGEAALSAAVSALQVTEQPGTPDVKDHLELLMAMRDNLPVKSEILNEYIRVVKEKPERADAVTELFLRGVSSSLISGRAPSDIGVCVCALCAALRGRRRRGRRARAALHALLDAQEDVRALANTISAAVEDAEQLLTAHDAVQNGARRGADRLAAALLAHAMARVLARQGQDISPDLEPPAPLSSESVSLVRSSWRKLSSRAQLTLLRCAGRALAAAGDADKRDEDIEDTEDIGDPEHMGDISDIDTVKVNIKAEEDTRAAEETGGAKATESMEESKIEDAAGTRVAEREGGAALLAALNQPLPRASVFHSDRQQVLTNVTKLQLLFRSRFVSHSEIDIIETHFNCSQNSMDQSIDTPIKLETAEEKTPIKQESKDTMLTPKLEMKVKIPMKLVIPMNLKIPKMEAIKDPPMNVSPIGRVKTMKGQLKLDGFLKQITPVKKEKEDERSPERKRIRRERHERKYALSSGRS